MRYSENPARALLEMRERRILRCWPRLVGLHLVAVTPAWALTLALVPLMDHPSLAYYLGIGLMGSLIWSTLWLAFHQPALTLLRQVNDELGSGQLQASELCDTLARHSLRRSLQASTFLLVPLAIGLGCVPADYRLACLAIWLKTILVLLVAVPLVSYSAQCAHVWTFGRRRQLASLALLVVLLPMLAGLSLLTQLELPASSLVVLGILLTGACLMRQVTLLGLRRGPDLSLRLHDWWHDLVRCNRRGASGWRRLTSNPVALREFDREAGRVPGGPLSQLIWVYGPFVMLQALLLLTWRPDDPDQASALYLVLLVLVATITGLRAAIRCHQTLSEDLQPASLAVLRQTSLSSAQLLDGAVLAAALPRTAEALLLTLGTIPVALALQVSPLLVVPLAGFVILVPVCLAYAAAGAALEGRFGQLAILASLVNWASLVAVYTAAVMAMRSLAMWSDSVNLALDLGCLVFWLAVVSVPFVLDTRWRALRRLKG